MFDSHFFISGALWGSPPCSFEQPVTDAGIYSVQLGDLRWYPLIQNFLWIPWTIILNESLTGDRRAPDERVY